MISVGRQTNCNLLRCFVGRGLDPADPVPVFDWYVEWYYFRNDHRKMPKNRHLISFVQPGRFRYLIGGVRKRPTNGMLNNNLSLCLIKPVRTKHFLSRRQKTVEFLKNICYNTLNQTCRISSLVEWSLPKPQRRVRFPYPAPEKEHLLSTRQKVFLFSEINSFRDL